MKQRKSSGAACSSCNSSRILAGDRFGGLSGVSVTAKVPIGSRRVLLKTSEVAAEVCVDCGAVRLRATDLAPLRAAWEQRAAVET